MKITKLHWKEMIQLGGVELDMVAEKEHIKTCFESSGFDPKTAKLYVNYCLSYAAVTGLTWSDASCYLYPALDEQQKLYIAHTYRAACQLAFSFGKVKSIQGWAIREGDTVSIKGASQYPQISQSSLSPGRGDIKGGVAVAILEDDSVITATINKDEINTIMENGTQAWATVFVDEMIKKSAIWRVLGNVSKASQPLKDNMVNFCDKHYPNDLLLTKPPLKDKTKSGSLCASQVRVSTKKNNYSGLVETEPSLLQYL
jgi:recombinational DNA repair protein RecT